MPIAKQPKNLSFLTGQNYRPILEYAGTVAVLLRYLCSHSRRLKMGVTVDVIQSGDGVIYPKPGQTVVFHYTGTLIDGEKFDSSKDRGKPFEFRIGGGQFIKGWDEGIAQMSLGERSKLTITPDYGYGLRGIPGIIPPDATLIFEVELLGLK